MRMVTVQRERIYLSFTLSISFQPLQLFSHLCYSWSHPSQPQLHTLSIHYCPAVVPHTYICNSWLHSMHWLVACPSSSHLCHIWLHSRHWLLTCPSSSNSATVGYIPSIDYWPTLAPHISATVGYIAACSRSTSFCALTKNINSHRVHINQ